MKRIHSNPGRKGACVQASLRSLAIVSSLALLGLPGCGSVKSTLGLDRKAPDEFAVVSRAPLSLPPDYALRPPRPGERRPQDAPQREQARAVLTGLPVNQTPAAPGEARAVERAAPAGELGAAGSGGSGLTAGETALLGKIGASTADPDIRRRVNEEQAILAADDRGFVERLMFWRTRQTPVDVVDAPKEQQRVQESVALGTPVTGEKTPTIERKGGTFAKGINIF